MSIRNLHSLLDGRWFIHESYGHSLLPSLFAILEGKMVLPETTKIEPYVFVAKKDKTATLINAADYNGNNSDSNSQYVAVINLKDPIYKYNQECGPRGTKTKMAVMSQFERDPNCAGVVLDIDSGGGQVSGTPEFYDFIKNFSKPVVSYTDGLMCSAAYYIGSAASHIIANKRADAIGSIGVMVHFIDLNGYYQKQGASVITEYATQSTEKNKAFEELLKGNPELYIKTELDPIAEDFIADIKAVRPNVSEEVFKGATWGAADALAKNLVDELGTLQDAIDKVFDLSNSSNSNSNKNQSNKSKTMSKTTKSFPVLQGILGIEGDGIAIVSGILGGEKGVAVSEEQLGLIETALSGHETALTAEKDNVTTANNKVSALETAVDAAITAAGLEPEEGATTASKITLLGAKVVEYGNRSGAKGTKAKADGDSFEDKNEIVDASDAHNQIYNKI